ALAEADLRRGAAALVDGLRGPGVLLPVDVRPGQIHELIDLALSSVAGRTVYGAPDGVADVLRRPLVAYSVVQRTLEAAGSDAAGAELGWLSRAQREVVVEALDGGEIDRARS